jgi:hypothetical protein
MLLVNSSRILKFQKNAQVLVSTSLNVKENRYIFHLSSEQENHNVFIA